MSGWPRPVFVFCEGPEPWGLTEMWIEDPDGGRIVLVEVPAAHPADHPLRRGPRSASPAT